MKYLLCYNVPLGRREDGTIYYRNGSQYVTPPEDLDMALSVCDYMNLEYGPETHWVEDEGGNRIEQNAIG